MFNRVPCHSSRLWRLLFCFYRNSKTKCCSSLWWRLHLKLCITLNAVISFIFYIIYILLEEKQTPFFLNAENLPEAQRTGSQTDLCLWEKQHTNFSWQSFLDSFSPNSTIINLCLWQLKRIMVEFGAFNVTLKSIVVNGSCHSLNWSVTFKQKKAFLTS